jgi:hypothetical protein
MLVRLRSIADAKAEYNAQRGGRAQGSSKIRKLHKRRYTLLVRTLKNGPDCSGPWQGTPNWRSGRLIAGLNAFVKREHHGGACNPRKKGASIQFF